MRRVLVLSLVVLVGLSVGLFAQAKRYPELRRLKPPPAGRALLTSANLTCDKVFLSPGASQGTFTTAYPMAMRVNGSSRKYYLLAGDNHVYEFAEPAGSACGTALASIAQATLTQDWGAFPTVATGDSNNYIPNATGSTQAYAFGLNYDETSGYLFYSWTATYAGVPTGQNSFAAASFGASSLSLIGCWGLNARAGTVGQPYGASGTLNIPSWFISQYLPAGQRLGVGLGGPFATIGAKNSFGPSVEAIPMPSGNACASNTNYQQSTGTVLARFPTVFDTGAPTCSKDLSREVGCVHGGTPGANAPAQTAFANYSLAYNVEDWDPYGGHGWWHSQNNPRGNWYDDGTKTGLLYLLSTSSGWLNTTVSASPAPTYVAGVITFTIPTVNMHDGANLQIGDTIWVQTCTVGLDSGCALENNNHLSVVSITAVNAGTGAITATVTSADPGLGNHKPVVGGKVWAGGVYAHGSPQPTRKTLLLQIYNPSTLLNVTGTNPVYASELVLSSSTGLVPYFGYPGGATPGVRASNADGISNDPVPSGVGVDNTNHKIALMFRSGSLSGGLNAALIVVLSVN